MRKPGINLTLGVVLLIVSFGIAAPSLWGLAQLVKEEDVAQANGGGGAGGGGATGGPVQVTLVAENIMFDPTSITASAGVEVTVTLDNRDAGVLHNVAFYTDRSASSPIHVGELITGVATEDVVFTSPSTPGSYFFRCDVHPDTMTGVFNVQ
jgi:plastocyanin